MTITETLTTIEETSPNLLEPSTLLTGSEPKLWAGKYKSAEELETAYKNSAKVYEENQQLKKQFEIPEEYQIPSDLVMRESELNELKNIAKKAGLNQDQFAKTAIDMQNRINSQLSSFEKTKNELGEANLNLLNDYVTKNYPASLRDHVLTKLIKDKEAMADALKHRDSILNTQAPGMDKGDSSKPVKYDGEKELKEAAMAAHKNPRDKVAQNRYIETARQVGHERFKK